MRKIGRAVALLVTLVLPAWAAQSPHGNITYDGYTSKSPHGNVTHDGVTSVSPHGNVTYDGTKGQSPRGNVTFDGQPGNAPRPAESPSADPSVRPSERPTHNRPDNNPPPVAPPQATPAPEQGEKLPVSAQEMRTAATAAYERLGPDKNDSTLPHSARALSAAQIFKPLATRLKNTLNPTGKTYLRTLNSWILSLEGEDPAGVRGSIEEFLESGRSHRPK
jgi:hypothetical protein